MTLDFEECLHFTKSTSEKAGDIIQRYFESTIKARYKGKYDIVTDIDLKTEKLIVKEIENNYPNHDIVTEETDLDRKDSDYTWFIDPISGTTNYLHGLPVFSVSIGLAYKKEPIIGAVFDPLRDELFSGAKGKSSFLNGREIEISKIKKLEESLVGTGFPYDINGRKKNLRYLNRIISKVQGIRRSGSVAIDLCHVACGRLDGFWAIGLKPWDV
ncbi:MAG: inositol monophosphatase family protein, partial [Thermoplasmatota archaeon]